MKEEFKPYIPAEKVTAEFTVTSVIMGVLLAIIFAATILQKLFFKYVFKSAEDENPRDSIKRAKQVARIAKRKAGK